jgi:hypothetical protein
MNVRTIVTLRLSRRNRPIHITGNIHHVWRLRDVRFRGLFNHVAGLCNSRAVWGLTPFSGFCPYWGLTPATDPHPRFFRALRGQSISFPGHTEMFKPATGALCELDRGAADLDVTSVSQSSPAQAATGVQA